MGKVEVILNELRLKEERDREEPDNKSEFLDQRELMNDQDLKILLENQEKILKKYK